MIRCLSIALLCACASLALAQSDVDSLLAKVAKSRSQLPPFAATYKETLSVPDGDNQPQQPENSVSWGSRNSTLIYECAVGPDASYIHLLGDDKGSEQWKLAESKHLNKDGLVYMWESGGSQGAITSHKTGEINAAALGYEIQSGEPITGFARAGRPVLVNPTTITTDNGSAKFTFEFSSTEGQTQMVRYTTDGPIWQLVEVTAWLRYKEFEFPKSATITRKREGRVFQTIRYDLIKLVDKPEELLTWHGWSEGSIVNDFRSNPVSIRVYSKGQLIHDPRFDDRSATDLSWRRMLVILAAAVVALWLIFAVRTLLRRRGALPNKSEGSV